MIRVKVCGMRDPLNVRDICEVKPDFMGFIFYRHSKRYVGENPDLKLFRNIPSEIIKTGVFVDESKHRIIEIASMAELKAVQLHGNETPSLCCDLKASGFIVMKVFRIDQEFNFNTVKPYTDCCDYFLFDTKSERSGGSGKKFNWQQLENYTIDKPFFLSGGISPDDSTIIRSLKIKGLFGADINSRFEISPGIKDVVKTEMFIKDLKEDSYDL